MRSAILATMVISLFAGATASAAVSGPGEVGGPPTRPLGPAEEGKQTTPARVIGAGQSYDGWLEIDAYGWRAPADSIGERRQFCTWIEFATEPHPFFGSCLGTGEIERPITIESLGWTIGPKRSRETLIGGALSPRVARVVLTVDPPGRQADRTEATVARVSGSLQRQLHQPSPFGYFFVKVRGQISAKYFRAIAYDAHGRKLGSAGGLNAKVP